MTLLSLLTEAAEILSFTQSGEDAYGNPRPTWDAEGSGTAVYGRLEQIARDENVTDRDTQVTRWRFYMPAGTVITGRDRLATSEGVLEVEGPPRRMRTPTGEHHVVAYLRQAAD